VNAVSKKVSLIYTPAYLKYGFGEDHPFNSRRLELTLELSGTLGILSEKDILEPKMATEKDLQLFHSPEYIQAVSRCIRDNKYGLASEDNTITPEIHRAASFIVGGTIMAADLLLSENYDHVFNIGGGLHHAQRELSSGFCVYNDLVIAIKYIQENYNLRIAYLDLDAHHGDGVQNAFYNDPQVLTISIHETGRYLFPGTGTIFERGKNAGYGYAVNIPLEAFSENDSYLHVLDNVVYPLLKEFKPDILIAQCGCDGHILDPLTHLTLTMDGFLEIYKRVHSFAHEFTQGKLLCTGGGGYNPWQVVPRAWTALWSEISERPFTPEIPASLVNKWISISGEQIPARITDGDSFCIAIPRKKEIREKNFMTAAKVLNCILFDWKKGI
jgi:acetoin utilization protein AcuC